MAGESVLPITECPDQIGTLAIIPGHGLDGVVDGHQTLFYAERDTILDAAFIRSIVGDDDVEWTLQVCADGVAPGSGTDVSDSMATLTTANNNKVQQWTIVETANLIPAGSALVLEEGAGTSTARHMVIMLRIRTRVR